MSQLTFAEAEYQNKKRKTRREIFLEKMDAIIPWKRLENRAAKHYPKGEMGRPPYPLATSSAYLAITKSVTKGLIKTIIVCAC